MNVSRNDEKRVLREAMVQIFELQLRLGGSVDDARVLAQSCIRDASRLVLRHPDGTENIDVEKFGSLLRSWHRKTRYLTREGFPRHLALEGRNGLRSLVNAHYPRSHSDSVIRSLRLSGLIKLDGRGKWFPTTKHAVFPALTRELLVHFSEGVSRFVKTMARNVKTRNRDETLFERASTVSKLPVSAGPEFRAFVNRQALVFLEAVDDWLEGRVEESKRSREKKCAAGVFAFAFIDDLTERRRAID
jgi:hypothetical protein